jgi:poly(ADP-ribose) glycohydrolase
MKTVRRELNKALIAFSYPNKKVLSTGKWGCGAFGGDPQLKFMIQWMAATVAERPMIFHTFQDNDRLE